MRSGPRSPRWAAGLIFAMVAAMAPPLAAQEKRAPGNPPATADALAHCAAMRSDPVARLTCFDKLAESVPSTIPGDATRSSDAQAPAGGGIPLTTEPVNPAGGLSAGRTRSCDSRAVSELSWHWELEPASDCGTFGIRGYRPISLSWIGSDSVNTAPSSPAAGHTAAFRPYSRAETRIQLSVRTKIASGLLTQESSAGRDSLWFAYTQQSYWQLFNGTLSRPFRTTDHEPELSYIYPADAELPGGWRLRYAGVSAVHQSNGQSLPLSRSWNRVVLMAGIENGSRYTLQARVWGRVPERSANDDNPDISDQIGRLEVTGRWHVNADHTLSATLRHSLRESARGSVRLEWLYRLAGSGSDSAARGLRWHTQLFSGYGDSLLDYNRRRTVLSVGLSLVDF